ncbi:PadR family transcriptional regulator [uncultured Friedmanniella sp.]|uniref:PadR family transcriptional regulator n=1 Tax=uncultured Friedmanniella sp. TaxID=335381 RepID=UPI0035CB572C
MSLRFALLGLLAEEPSSGYDLTRRFEEGIGTFAWSAGHSQIYPELAKLAAAQLVEVVSEGARGRRVYDVTPAGRDALRDWLLGPHTDGGTVRNEFVLRLFLLSALEDADAQVVLRGVQEFAAQQIAVLESAQQEMAAAGLARSAGPNLAAKFGALSYQATHEWAGWASEQVAWRTERS